MEEIDLIEKKEMVIMMEFGVEDEPDEKSRLADSGAGSTVLWIWMISWLKSGVKGWEEIDVGTGGIGKIKSIGKTTLATYELSFGVGKTTLATNSIKAQLQSTTVATNSIKAEP